jgi:protein SCO1/2
MGLHSPFWLRLVLGLALVAGMTVSCGGSSGGSSGESSNPPAAADERRYPFKGQILALAPDGAEASIKHDDIPGFMSAMTMSYKVRDAKEFAGLKPGDLITGTLVVETSGAYLTEVMKVGEAPLDQPAQQPPPASSGFELLRPGETVPDMVFTDQDGHKRQFASFRGSPIVLTFVYTRCPMPTFCPLMDRHFAAIQTELESDPALRSVRLASVSFDPETDTPAVLKSHAARLGADPARWSFLTGDRDEIDQFATRFGVSVVRELNDQGDITHTLRTAVVDGDGHLFKVYTGNAWTPEQVITDLKQLG